MELESAARGEGTLHGWAGQWAFSEQVASEIEPQGKEAFAALWEQSNTCIVFSAGKSMCKGSWDRNKFGVSVVVQSLSCV